MTRQQAAKCTHRRYANFIIRRHEVNIESRARRHHIVFYYFAGYWQEAEWAWRRHCRYGEE